MQFSIGIKTALCCLVAWLFVANASLVAHTPPTTLTNPLFSSVDHAFDNFVTGTASNLFANITPGDGNILYVNKNVDQDAAGYTGSGDSWDNALPELADALQWAREQHDADPTVFDTDPLKIYVATGTYKPLYKVAEEDTNGNPTTDRDNAFMLVPHVQLYGGFPEGGGTFDSRDWEANPTTLSGDFNDNDVIEIDENNGPVLLFSGNGENAYHVVVSVGNVGSARIDGFTIKRGNASYTGPNPRDNKVVIGGETIVRNYGGGIYCASSSPVFANIHLTENSGGISGGGMRNEASSPTLTHVLIEKNTASQGGGISNVSGTSLSLHDVTITQNNAGFGGGIFNHNSTLQATRTTIRNNRASNEGGGMNNGQESSVTLTDVTLLDNNAADYGGAIYNVENSALTLTNGVIQGNIAGYAGGGLYNEKSSFTLINTLIDGNTAKENYGGGIYNNNEGVRSLPVLLRNVTLTANTVKYYGGGFYNAQSNPVITNATVAGNKATSNINGVGIFNIDASPQINNSIFYENRNSNGVLDHLATVNTSNPVIKNSLVQADGGWDDYWGQNGGGNIVSLDNPFTDFEDGDYTLSAGSPTIDAGDNTLYTDAGGDLANDTDLAGNPRVYDGNPTDDIIDMGAYEHQGEAIPITPRTSPPGK